MTTQGAETDSDSAMDSPEPEWKKNQEYHNEASRTIRRTMMVLLSYSVFCFATLLSPASARLSMVKLPIANVNVSYFDFIMLGPTLLIAFVLYAHIFIAQLPKFSRDDIQPLPYIFNLDFYLTRLITGLILYVLPVFVLLLFALRAVRISYIEMLLGLAVLVAFILSLLWLHYNKNVTIIKIGNNIIGGEVWYKKVRVPLAGLMIIIGALGYIKSASLPTYDGYDDNGLVAAQSPGYLDTFEIGNTNLLTKLSKFHLLEVGLVLSGGNFEESNLSKMNLRRAVFSKAEMNGLDIRYRDLFESYFAGAMLEATNFSGSYLERANMSKVQASRAIFNKANLKEVDFEGAILKGAFFTDAELAGARFDNADLRGATIKQSQLDQACGSNYKQNNGLNIKPCPKD